MTDDDLAPDGQVWVCSACKRRALHRRKGGLSPSWDDACAAWAVLCFTQGMVLDALGFVRKAEMVKQRAGTAWSPEELATEKRIAAEEMAEGVGS